MRRPHLSPIWLALACSAGPRPAPTPTTAPPTCEYSHEPAPASPALAPPDGECKHPDPRLAAALRPKVHERWSRQWPSGRLRIDDACDRLDPSLDRVTFTFSSGHGGTLRLAELQRRPDGDYDLVTIDYDHYDRAPKISPDDPAKAGLAGPLELHHGHLDARLAAPLLAELRAAMHLEIEEHPPPSTPDTIVLGNVSITSNDHHVSLELRDARGRGLRRSFAGYDGTGDDQEHGVALAIAREAWFVLFNQRLRERLTPVTAADPASRALFARAFAQVRERREDHDYWYVRERLLAMTAALGDDTHVPDLLEVLAKPGDDAHRRSQLLAVDAIAAITGHDVRRDPSGAARPVERVIAQTLAACRRPSAD